MFSGTAVVLQDIAALWTDGRYYLQAESELDCNWFLMKISEKGTSSLDDWIIEKLKPGSTIGADAKLIPYQKVFLNLLLAFFILFCIDIINEYE